VKQRFFRIGAHEMINVTFKSNDIFQRTVDGNYV